MADIKTTLTEAEQKAAATFKGDIAQLSNSASADAALARSKASAFLVKQESWLARNKRVLVIGAVVAAVVLGALALFTHAL